MKSTASIRLSAISHDYVLFLSRYNITYTEDGSAVSVFADNFQITNEENALVVRTTINVAYSTNLLPGVQDVLSSTTSSDRFSATFNPSIPSLVIDAVGPLRLLTTQDQMRDFLRGVMFSTNDQAPDVSRNLTVVVEELPLGRGPLVPTIIPIDVILTNDQPILTPSPGIRIAALMEYLPQATLNTGFNTSFLLTDDDVVDLDRVSRNTQDFIGLAIIDMFLESKSQTTLGEWQYYYNMSEWRPFPDVSYCDPLFASPSTRIRFSPFPSLDKENGQASITYLAWDGSSRDSPCNQPSTAGETGVEFNNK